MPSTPGDQAKNASMKQKDVSYLLIQIRWLTKNYTSAYFSILHTVLIAEASDFLFLGGGVVPKLRWRVHFCAALRAGTSSVRSSQLALPACGQLRVLCGADVLY